VFARAALLIDDRVCVDGRREQERRDGRRHRGDDSRDQVFLDDSRAARHCGNESQRVCAGVDGERRVVDRRHAADLDTCGRHARKLPGNTVPEKTFAHRRNGTASRPVRRTTARRDNAKPSVTP
jgi:hypothetical protein